jgi:hypothetical protein
MCSSAEIVNRRLQASAKRQKVCDTQPAKPLRDLPKPEVLIRFADSETFKALANTKLGIEYATGQLHGGHIKFAKFVRKQYAKTGDTQVRDIALKHATPKQRNIANLIGHPKVLLNIAKNTDYRTQFIATCKKFPSWVTSHFYFCPDIADQKIIKILHKQPFDAFLKHRAQLAQGKEVRRVAAIDLALF